MGCNQYCILEKTIFDRERRSNRGLKNFFIVVVFVVVVGIHFQYLLNYWCNFIFYMQ